MSGDEHVKRRRLWDRGMSSDALDSYAGFIERRGRELVEEVEGMMGTHASSSFEGEKEVTVDIAKWIGYFSFDFMGDMA